jgi:hypothetical protein
MTIYYAASTGGFYDSEIHGDRIPADSTEIDELEHKQLLLGQAMGQVISATEEGIPCLKDAPLPTTAELAAAHNAPILAEITAIETDRQPRAIREATLTGNRTLLQKIDDDIAALRAQLLPTS